MGTENLELEEMDTVTLTLDDNTEVECDIVAIYPVGDNQYIALMPIVEEGAEQSEEVYLYRYIDHGEDEEPELENILEDDEYEIAADAFDELLDNWEFDEM